MSADTPSTLTETCGWCGKDCSDRYWLWDWAACRECFLEITAPNCELCGDSGRIYAPDRDECLACVCKED